MHRVVVTMVCACALVATAAFAQPAPAAPQAPRTAPAQPPRTAAPEAPPAPPAPKPQPVNIRIDIDITQKNATGTPFKKSASMVTGDGLQGSIRSATAGAGFPTSPLSVDARPTILPDGKIRLMLNLSYETPNPAGDTRDSGRSTLSEGLQLLLESGRSVVAAESPGAVGDLQFTVEIRATILK